MSRAAEAAKSERTYRRRMKHLRDYAVRSAFTARLHLLNTQANTELLEMPDGSVTAVNRIHRRRRPNRPQALTGESLTMARAILHRPDPQDRPTETGGRMLQPDPPTGPLPQVPPPGNPMVEVRPGSMNQTHLPKRPPLDLRRHDRTCPMGPGKARIFSGPHGPQCQAGCRISLTGPRPRPHRPHEHTRPQSGPSGPTSK